MKLLTLNDSYLIARGWHRQCYQHPDHEDRCIKIVVNGDDTETKREQAYYRLLEKRLQDWRSVPRFHGNVDTTLGQGAVFDLVRDYDGKISKTLADYIEREREFNQYAPVLMTAMFNLIDYQLKHNVLTMSLKPKNLLFQVLANGDGVMHIIDNLGNSDWIPLCTYSHFFGQQKIRRKWKKFLTMLEKKHLNRPDLMYMFKSLETSL